MLNLKRMFESCERTVLLMPFFNLESELSAFEDIKICLVPPSSGSKFGSGESCYWTQEQTIQQSEK